MCKYDPYVSHKEIHIEGFRPEWCISNIYHASDTPFWPGTLDMMRLYLILKCRNNAQSKLFLLPRKRGKLMYNMFPLTVTRTHSAKRLLACY